MRSPARIMIGLACVAAGIYLLFSPLLAPEDANNGASAPPGSNSAWEDRAVSAVQRDYSPRQVVEPYPAIVDPPHLTAAQWAQPNADAKDDASAPQDDELVLGVVVNGEARAYPINMMTGPSREIFNDRLGGQRIAATW